MNLGIMVREEFVEIFKNSKSISTLKRKTYFKARRARKGIEKIKELIYEAESESEIREVDRLKEKLEELLTKIQRYEQDEEESIKKLNISQNSTIWEYSILMGVQWIFGLDLILQASFLKYNYYCFIF